MVQTTRKLRSVLIAMLGVTIHKRATSMPTVRPGAIIPKSHYELDSVLAARFTRCQSRKLQQKSATKLGSNLLTAFSINNSAMKQTSLPPPQLDTPVPQPTPVLLTTPMATTNSTLPVATSTLVTLVSLCLSSLLQEQRQLLKSGNNINQKT